jgi:hypothetical protein
MVLNRKINKLLEISLILLNKKTVTANELAQRYTGERISQATTEKPVRYHGGAGGVLRSGVDSGGDGKSI